MNNGRKPKGYWNRDNCLVESLKYESRRKFEYGSQSAYNSARRNGWLDEICSHMKELKKPNGYWNRERCQDEALKYKSKKEFYNKNISAYDKSKKNGWLDDICSHMKELKKPNGYWTKERCFEKSSLFNNKREFREKYGSAYNSARRNGWLDEICSHMKTKNNSNRCIYLIYFTDKIYIGLTNNIKKRFKQHLRKGIIHKYINKTNSYPSIIQLSNYIDVEESQKLEKEYIKLYGSYFTLLNTTNGGELGSNIRKWTKDKCQEEALKYRSKKEFRKNNENIYSISSKNKWLNDICSHMIKNN